MLSADYDDLEIVAHDNGETDAYSAAWFEDTFSIYPGHDEIPAHVYLRKRGTNHPPIVVIPMPKGCLVKQGIRVGVEAAKRIIRWAEERNAT